MKRRAIALSFLSAFLALPCLAQSSSEINALIRKSKLIDTGRPVNSSVSGNQVVVSTYCDPKSSDRDCKITALLMMKDLNQHYKSVQRVRVLFYDPVRSDSYRQVDAKEGDAALVDMGKPVDEVLGQLDVVRQSTRANKPLQQRGSFTSAQSERPKSRGLPAPYAAAMTSGPISYAEYRNEDGSVLFVHPKGWLKTTDSVFTVAKFTGMINGHVSSIALVKNPSSIAVSLESLAEQHEEQEKGSIANYKLHQIRARTTAGLPAMYYEASGTLPSGVSGTERTIWMLAGGHCYYLMALADDEADREMQKVFETAAASLRIR